MTEQIAIGAVRQWADKVGSLSSRRFLDDFRFQNLLSFELDRRQHPIPDLLT